VAAESKKWNTTPPPLFFRVLLLLSFLFFLGFSCNGLLWFLPLLSGFFSVFGFLVFLPCSLLFVLPCRRVSFPSSILFFPRFFFSGFSSLYSLFFFVRSSLWEKASVPSIFFSLSIFFSSPPLLVWPFTGLL